MSDKHSPTRCAPAARMMAVSCALILLIEPGLPACAATDLSDPQAAVEAGSNGLKKSPTPPWYDKSTDDFRPAKVKPPRNWNWYWPSTGVANFLLFAGWILLAVVLALAAYLIVRAYLGREINSTIKYDQGPAGGDISRVEELPVALETAPEDYLAEAERLYRRGDYAQAIIYLFSHQLLQLDRKHWIRLVKGKTNRQYLREIRRSPAPSANQLARMFEQTVLLFEEVFFGKRLPERLRIEAIWKQSETFDALVHTAEEQAA